MGAGKERLVVSLRRKLDKLGGQEYGRKSLEKFAGAFENKAGMAEKEGKPSGPKDT